MGAGVMFILLLIIIVAVIAAFVFTGIGAALWTKKTVPPESGSRRDSVDQESGSREARDASPTPDSTVAPDANGVYHRELK